AIAEADTAQAEAARLQDEVDVASDALREATNQLESLRTDMIDVGLELGRAQEQVRVAQEDLDTARQAQAAAELAKSEAEAAMIAPVTLRHNALGERGVALAAGAARAERLEVLNAEVAHLHLRTEELTAQAHTLAEQNRILSAANPRLLSDNQRLQVQSE